MKNDKKPEGAAAPFEDTLKRLEENRYIGERLAVEWGYRAHERGWNLERTLLEFDKLMEGTK